MDNLLLLKICLLSDNGFDGCLYTPVSESQYNDIIAIASVKPEDYETNKKEK